MSQDGYLGEGSTPPSLHRYLYAYANPTVYIDLTGYKSIFGDATQQLERFKEWLGEQNKAADSQLAAAAIGTAQFVATLGEGITRPLDVAANVAQEAVGVDDQQVRDELAATRVMVTDAIDFVANGDYGQVAKNVHQAAVNETVKALEGDVSASANVTQGVLAAALVKSGGKGKPQIIKENPSGLAPKVVSGESTGGASTTGSRTLGDLAIAKGQRGAIGPRRPPSNAAGSTGTSGRKVYRQLSADDAENLANGKGLTPKGTSNSIPDHVAGEPTGHISCSMSPSGCARFSSGNGLAEIDVDAAIQGNAKYIDHNNVLGAVKRAGDSRAVRDARRAEEVLFRGAIPPEAVKIIAR